MKKGFTLIELIAVFALLAAVSVITIPSYLKIQEEKKEKLYDTTITEIIETTKDYITTNPEIFNISVGGHLDISTNTLCNENFLSCPLNDPRDNSEISGYVRITRSSSDYTYTFVRN